MEPPIGFIPLRDAVYLVGRKVFGSSWCPSIGDPTIQGLFNPEIERVVTMIASACEAQEIAATYRTVTGGTDAVPLDMWHRPGWRHYFATGTIDLDLPMIDANGVPNKFGDMVKCTREIFVRSRDVDQFVDTLTQPKGRAGAPAKHDWSTWRQLFEKECEKRGDPRDPDQMPKWNSVATAAGTLLNLHGGDDAPDAKTLARKISEWLPALERGT